MKTLALLALAFASAQAHAVDFAGHWSGTGTMTQSSPILGNKTSPCSLVDITLEHLPAELTIRRYHAICGNLDSDWGPHAMEIRGTEVFEDGEKTGTLEGDTLLTLQPGATQYAFNLRLKTPEPGQPAVLESYYGVKNAVGVIVIEGSLASVAK